jgi:hypothetical protein
MTHVRRSIVTVAGAVALSVVLTGLMTPFAAVFAFMRNDVAERLAFFLLYLILAAGGAYIMTASKTRASWSERAAAPTPSGECC